MRMWIEILQRLEFLFRCPVILYMRMWIEIENYVKTEVLKQGHPLYEDVNWNSNVSERDFRIICHPLYEDVNWNVNDIQVLREGFRHPLYEDVNWN